MKRHKYFELHVPEDLYLATIRFIASGGERAADELRALREEIGMQALQTRALIESQAELERERVGASQLEDEVVRLRGEVDDWQMRVDKLGEQRAALHDQIDAEHRATLRERERADQLAAQYDPILAENARLRQQVLDLLPLHLDAVKDDLPGGLHYYDALLTKEQATEPAQRPAVDVAPSPAEDDHANDDRPAAPAPAAEAPAVPEPVEPHGGTPGLNPELAAALDLFLADMVEVSHEPHARVSNPELEAAYEQWRHEINAPELGGGVGVMGRAMNRAGHGKRRRQARRGEMPQYGGTRPMVFEGLVLKTHAAPRESETESHTSTEAPPAWLSSPTPEPKRRVVYLGDRPGRELRDKQYRDLVAELIRQGWEYRAKNGNGAGKPRVVSPDGQTYALANTPSDYRGIRNAKSHLRRLGASI